MRSYGATIKKIRKEHGLSQKEVYSGVTSRSFYSLFEKGESDISVSKFKLMLDNLALTFEEFLYIHDEHSSKIDLITHHILFFWKENMYEELLNLYNSYKNSTVFREHYLALYAYSFVFSIKKEEWNLYPDPVYELRDYYQHKKVLTLGEINDSIFLINALDVDDKIELLDKARLSLQKYKKLNLTKFSEIFASLALIKVQILINKDKIQEASLLIEDIEFEISSSQSVKAFLNYKTAEIIVGLQIDIDKWEKEIQEFNFVMDYIDPEFWTENTRIIQYYKNLALKKL